ncbi:NAD(P)H-dependent oxidoreductase [Bosea sp. (in: a-proteobacteria)]|jgi:NAD(P)H dehydrogenase (quinone)|uniref:NAD(P)H-dependent oxidoreductase n=1 Tax=Bosea sp. (in: a-proteobacteria) TaxID=1871050 RepID=UPI002DDD577C|nr:NAD(P)H-dependent oxidoreductase [Bosea sp. (in: a-proteobacteria)]HEV2512134.1 NAD(P)H-dependent oxidoreductase [Bosea sp. (in: a-proteobacteria)]
MNILIVFAHPEPESFCGALKDVAVSTLSAAGHAVVVSDLYRQGFSPVGDHRDFDHPTDAPFIYQAEQRRAHREGSYCEPIAAEHAKLMAADVVMFNFPLWWFGPPAILKGWIDRVMSVGFAYDSDRRFEDGGLQGRRGLITVTTGSPAERFVKDGARAYAPMDETLLPLQKGLFHYVGMTGLDPFVAYAAARVEPQTRARYLAEYRVHLEKQIDA